MKIMKEEERTMEYESNFVVLFTYPGEKKTTF
jgi:hypothetical protein